MSDRQNAKPAQTVADLFIKCLEAEGLKRIYGVPGEENADMMMSIERS